MPHKLRQLSGKEVIQILEKFGFEIKSQSGSHIKMKRKTGKNTKIIMVPNHSTITRGTLKSIYNVSIMAIPENELRDFFYTEDK